MDHHYRADGLRLMAGVTGLAFLAHPSGARAQGVTPAGWSVTAIGVAEYDTKHTGLLLGELSATAPGSGLTPMLGVQAYTLAYDVGATRTNVVSVRPYVGLTEHFVGGSLNGTIGYAFANQSVTAPVSATVGDQGSGAVVTGGWNEWGTGGPLGYQLLGSYNIRTQSLWTRGRITTRLSESPTLSTRLGGEVAFLDGPGYGTIQPGVVLELHHHDRILGIGSGMKFFRGGGSAVYIKLEGVLPLVR